MATASDNELKAIEKVLEAVAPLDSAARGRVMAYVINRFDGTTVRLVIGSSTGKYQRSRCAIAVLYAFIGVAAMLATSFVDSLVYFHASHEGFADLWRCFWLVPFVFFGVAIRAYIWRTHDDSPWLPYLRYLGMVGIGAFLFFAACHSFLGLDNWLFYPTSAIVTIGFGMAPGKIFKYWSNFGSATT